MLKVSPVDMAGVKVSVVTASMYKGESQIAPGFSIRRLDKSSQSPVPLGSSRSYHLVQQTATSKKVISHPLCVSSMTLRMLNEYLLHRKKVDGS